MVAIFLWISPAIGEASEDTFRQGVSAFRAENYEEAIQYFEAARAAGLDTGALHFNLGVSYYRAGRIDAAEESLSRAARSERMSAPALYQLGRIARQRGRVGQARRYFLGAANSARTEALRRHARSALAAIDRTMAPPDYVYLSVGGGHDSNVSLTPSDASGVSEESDLFVEGMLLVRRPIDGRNYLRSGLYSQAFLDEDDFNLLSVHGGVGRVGAIGAWRWDAHVDLRHQAFGGEAFENALLAGGTLSQPLDAVWSLDLDYRLQWVRGADGFGFLDGSEHHVAATLDERGRTGWRVSAFVATADRDDRETSDDFFSFSWIQTGLDAGYGLRLEGPDRLHLRADWRRRDYDGVEVRNGVRLGDREDERIGLEAAFERPLDDAWSARAALRFEERDSNLGEFDYDRTVIRLGLDRVF